MFKLGKSVSTASRVHRPLPERITSASYAAMSYWFYRWDWGEAVAFDGLLAAGSKVDPPGVVEYVGAELARWARAHQPGDVPNPMGPSVALLAMLQSKQLPDSDVQAGWALLEDQARVLVESGRRVGAVAPESDGRMVFVDSLYGAPEFLVRLGDATSAPGLVEDAVEMTLKHCGHLQRPDGLFAHAGDLEDATAPAIAWGRGNGWAALGLARMIEALGADRAPSELLERFRALCAALGEAQTPGGRWRNLVDDPHSYPESSTTAMVTAAMTSACANGVLPSESVAIADRGWASIADRIDVSGHLVGVSYRPGVNSDPSRYEHTPAYGSYPWGQGPYLLAATQRLTSSA